MRITRRSVMVAIGTLVLSGCSAKDLVRRGWTWRSDESIRREIKHAFSKAGPEFLALEVIVRSQKVTLKGGMRSQEQKLEAERLVWEVTGVDALFNDVQVK